MEIGIHSNSLVASGFAQEYYGGYDIPYKGYEIGIQEWECTTIYRVYKVDSPVIEYEGKSIEDCKAWIDGVTA